MYIYLYNIYRYIYKKICILRVKPWFTCYNIMCQPHGLNISYSAYRKSVGGAQGLGHLYHINYIFLIIHLKSQRCKKS